MKLIKTLSLYIILFATSTLLAQKAKIKKAEKSYNAFAYSKAINIYEEIADKEVESTDLLKKVGNSYYFNADLANAKKWYDKLFNKEGEIEPEYYFRYSHSLKSIGNYEKADKIMSSFYTLTNSSDKRGILFEKTPDYLEKIKIQSDRYEIENLNINSKYSDFAPSFYNNKLIFSSERDTILVSKNKDDDRVFLDLFSSDISSDEKLNQVIKFSSSINTEFHESTSVFTSDGNTVYFTRNNFSNNKLKKDSKGTIKLKIYKASKNSNGEWSSGDELPFNNDEYSVAHPSLNLEENKLYFSSDMPGGYGLSDIYEVDINPDGTFSSPKNLGEEINTEGRETFPFISKNGKLYFSSNGRPGLGGLDIYVITLSDNITDKTIYNLGEPINSSFDDFSFIIDDETKKGYFASNRPDGKGKDDIYRFCEALPLVENKNKIDEEIVITNSQEQNIEIEKQTIRKDVTPEKNLVTPAPNLRFNPIYFDFDRYNIREDAKSELNKIILAMKEYPNIKVEIKSHTDSRANNIYNMKLSNKRAIATINYLVKRKIERSRLSSTGYGETKLKNNCSNGIKCLEKKHKQNRRAEFVIIYN
ncbi:outer membrane protein OmpA-like peptidoglycan-associated protein [Tenacibaculum adriaticum]|uniref:Outer membrane protein OmpA-like peptidoglycan-associated protein n=1 Tax=Tenacibaculum adriaticum TaxID=413713 RepID=A0A5S5DRN3_9FLAO|nr:OmpA family protein [Tenacibaculum adriaticum]TYP98344.1 outer membrane protein OmpA-like peptidoglycan-associated protein [Tenacibaculum adriaticum]